MLLSLAQWLQTLSPEFGFFRVFQYLTFRAVMAALTALLIGLAFGPWVIRRLTELKIGQPIREYGVQEHLAKSGTPTMGGVLILIGIGVSTLLWFDWSNRFVWIVMLVTLRLRRDRLGRRLAQGGAQEPRRHALAREVLLAVGDRPGRGALPRVQRLGDLQPARAGAVPALGAERLLERPAAQGRPDRAVLQDHQLPAGRVRLHRADLLRHRRREQRGQPDRRPGRPGDHAGGDGRLGAGRLRLRHRQRRCTASTCCSPTSRAPASC